MLEVTDTLRHNATLAIGPLALAAGAHELRNGMLAESASVAALDGAIDLLRASSSANAIVTSPAVATWATCRATMLGHERR